MTTRAVDEVDEWDSAPFNDGYRGLHDLADDEFSGVVRAGRPMLCMLKGTVVGILEGDIEDFEDASGTAYRAPSPALPLLVLMQERNDEVRAKYYTEDTPISEVDGTLSDGGFTGYLELSENVLSGDYFVVYHEGRRMAVAFVGNTGQLLTEDEAFDRADGEVGIYEVRPTEIDPVEIPEVEDEQESSVGGAAGAAAAGADSTDDEPPAETETPAAEPSAAGPDESAAGASAGAAESAATDTTAASTETTDTEPDPETSESSAAAEASRSGAETEEPTGTDTETTPPTGASTDTESPGRTPSGTENSEAESPVESTDSEPSTGSTGAERSGSSSDRQSRSERTDPERSESERRERSAGQRNERTDRSRGSDTGRAAPDESRSSESRSGESRSSESRSGESRSSGSRTDDSGSGRDRTRDSRGEPSETGTSGRPETGQEAETGREAETGSDARAGSNPGRGTGGAGTDASGSAGGRGKNATTGGRGASGGAAGGRGGTGDAGSAGGQGAAGGTGSAGGPSGADRGAGGSATAGTADDLETRSIPSLDPAQTGPSTEPSGTSSLGVAGHDSGTAETAGTPAESRSESPSAGTGPDPSASGRSDPESGRAAGGQSTAETTDAARDRPSSPQGQGTSTPASQNSGAAGSGRQNSGAAGSGRQDASEPAEGAGGDVDARVADLEERLEDREIEIERLEGELADAEAEAEDLRASLREVRSERDDLRARIDDIESERDRLRSERDDLKGEIERLESELDGLETEVEEIEAEFGAATDAERRMSAGEALDQTNLFVRYESKGQATLESAHSGNASRQEVGKNLGLEYHTQFETDAVSVGGQPFDEFLRSTIQYQFVTWVINDLLYEIRDTGKTAALQELYDAIPRIDRAELNGTINAEYTEDGQERRAQESFDVVVRDRMGNPLMAANLNDSRQAASESMMSALVTASSHVGESTDALAASFLVTSSFFEPEALETAADATSGGLLNRDKRESFVKLARKRGYHLCLVEAREDKFHLAVPEL